MYGILKRKEGKAALSETGYRLHFKTYFGLEAAQKEAEQLAAVERVTTWVIEFPAPPVIDMPTVTEISKFRK